ncbi:hypothetical protein [Streptomyces sp. NBC_00103]|uniref:hypothetical protein n=1 Tax=Streptomyces sp. NBC_00103 TaxID=2975653 RepID=UPI002256FA90|nr:hypothetical protein [Streptomyces sp. NBC_00103]MCX5370126.1 hypothetical protein [Streptomyces sp. NBC_00103]
MDIRAFTCTARVVEPPRRWKTRSTPSSSTSEVETFSSPPVARMQEAATRYSAAFPIRAAAGLFSGYSSYSSSSLLAGIY